MSSNNKIVLTFQDGTIEANITKGNESIVKNVSYADLGPNKLTEIVPYSLGALYRDLTV